MRHPSKQVDQQTSPNVVGRFAPSPTGPLHLGSLTTAVASFCHAKSLGGQWRLRLEDTDFERCKSLYSDQILRDLDNLGLHWEGKVSYQSQRIAVYDDALDQLSQLSYACDCSRKTLSQIGSVIYPRLCLGQHKNKHLYKIRLIVPDADIVYLDSLQGTTWQNPAKSLGDSVITCKNGIYNYLFTAAIDDGAEGITHVVRGLDLSHMSSTQIWIRHCLALPPVASHAHLPLLYNAQGQKLSKQNLATPIDSRQPVQILALALRLLGQRLPDSYQTPKHALPCDMRSRDELLRHAIAHWDNTVLTNKHSLGVVE